MEHRQKHNECRSQLMMTFGMCQVYLKTAILNPGIGALVGVPLF
jgi:hypothetical protein